MTQVGDGHKKTARIMQAARLSLGKVFRLGHDHQYKIALMFFVFLTYVNQVISTWEIYRSPKLGLRLHYQGLRLRQVGQSNRNDQIEMRIKCYCTLKRYIKDIW